MMMSLRRVTGIHAHNLSCKEVVLFCGPCHALCYGQQAVAGTKRGEAVQIWDSQLHGRLSRKLICWEKLSYIRVSEPCKS